MNNKEQIDVAGVTVNRQGVLDRLTKSKAKNNAPLKLKLKDVLFDKVILAEDTISLPDEVSEGGIFIPVAALDTEILENRRMVRGIVVKAGNECKYVKDGDIVVFDKMQVIPTDIKGHEYSIIRETHIVVIEK